jgi:hypothetical protein
MSTVNLAEVLIHTAKYAHAAGVDPVTLFDGRRPSNPSSRRGNRAARRPARDLPGGRVRRRHRARARRPLSHDRRRARPPAPARAARHHPLLTELDGNRERVIAARTGRNAGSPWWRRRLDVHHVIKRSPVAPTSTWNSWSRSAAGATTRPMRLTSAAGSW